MNPPDLSKCSCTHCGGRIEFETDSAGQEVPCPHCGKQVLLYISPGIPRATVVTKKRWLPSSAKVVAGVAIFFIILAVWASLTDDSRNDEAGAPQLIFSGVLGLCFLVLGAVVGVGGYFLPTYIAWKNKKRNLQAIFILNLFTGWTFVGWVVALVWACMVEAESA